MLSLEISEPLEEGWLDVVTWSHTDASKRFHFILIFLAIKLSTTFVLLW